VVQTVRERFSCQACEKIAQPPSLFHPIARCRAEASLMVIILYGKLGNHLLSNHQNRCLRAPRRRPQRRLKMRLFHVIAVAASASTPALPMGGASHPTHQPVPSLDFATG
jgi:transposase